MKLEGGDEFTVLSDFKGLIKCTSCGKNFKRKLERKRPAFICSGFANYGKEFCSYNPIFEEDIIFTVSNHYDVLGRRIEGDMRDLIDRVEVKQGGYTINYKDGSTSIIDLSEDYGIKLKF